MCCDLGKQKQDYLLQRYHAFNLFFDLVFLCKLGLIKYDTYRALGEERRCSAFFNIIFLDLLLCGVENNVDLWAWRSLEEPPSSTVLLLYRTVDTVPPQVISCVRVALLVCTVSYTTEAAAHSVHHYYFSFFPF